jgi:RND family efflux transporter MFP subunit
MKSRNLILAAGAFSVLALIAGCKGKDQPTALVVRPAKVITVKAPVNSNMRYFPGRVEANQRVNLSFQVGGKVQTFPVLEGSDLTKGKVVAKLDPSEYQYNLQQATAKYNLAKSQEHRFGVLFKKGYISGSDYDKQKSALEIAKADLKQAKKDLADTVLRAPFDGKVIRKYVKLYQRVKPHEHITSFQDIDQIDVRVNVPENVIARMQTKNKPTLNVRFEALPGRTYKVTTKEFSAEADPETQTYDAVLTMPAPTDVNILPGMTAVLVIELPTRRKQKKNAYMIPSSAVFQNEQGVPSVWRVDPATKKIAAQVVTTGSLSSNDIQVFKGVKTGETLISAGVHFLHQDDEVSPIKEPQ